MLFTYQLRIKIMPKVTKITAHWGITRLDIAQEALEGRDYILSTDSQSEILRNVVREMDEAYHRACSDEINRIISRNKDQ